MPRSEATAPPSATEPGAVAAAEATEAFEISRAAFDGMIDGYAPLAVKFWRNMALVLKGRLTKTNEVIDRYMDVSEALQNDRLFSEIYRKR